MRYLIVGGLIVVALASGVGLGLLAQGRHVEVVISRYKNGGLLSVVPVDARGSPHGRVLFYHPNGKVQADSEMDHGQMLSYTHYYQSGRVSAKMHEDWISREAVVESFADEE